MGRGRRTFRCFDKDAETNDKRHQEKLSSEWKGFGARKKRGFPRVLFPPSLKKKREEGEKKAGRRDGLKVNQQR